MTADTTGCQQPDETQPLVSIITPTFNAEPYIAETIRSVAAQTYANWEHIIIDDASGDRTVDVVRALQDRDPRIRLIDLPENGGAAISRNAGIAAASGRFIAFLDSDDLWVPDKLSIQIGHMLKNNVPFTFAGYTKIDADGHTFGQVDVPARVSYRQVLRNNHIGCLTAVYDTAHFGRVDMPLIRKRQDLGLWLRLLRRTPYAEGLPDHLGRYRVRKGSISSNKADAARYTWRLYRDIEKLPLPVALYYFSCYAVNGVVKSYLKTRRNETTE